MRKQKQTSRLAAAAIAAFLAAPLATQADYN
jgi:hypothetical protein